MPRQKHYYGENHVHYLTRSIPQGGTGFGCLTPKNSGGGGWKHWASCGASEFQRLQLKEKRRGSGLSFAMIRFHGNWWIGREIARGQAGDCIFGVTSHCCP